MAGLTNSDPQVAGLRATIPEGMLTNYDRAQARGKNGIALMVNHVFTNCPMRVPVAVTASLTAGIIQACGNCGLYLCLPGPNEQPITPLPRLPHNCTNEKTNVPLRSPARQYHTERAGMGTGKDNIFPPLGSQLADIVLSANLYSEGQWSSDIGRLDNIAVTITPMDEFSKRN